MNTTHRPPCHNRGGRCVLNRGSQQVRQGGSIHRTASTGAHPVRGAVRDSWAGQGWDLARGHPLGFRGGPEDPVQLVVAL
ncbi:hypothetical protein ACFWCB_15895 [Streptomyces sp. NPDC060048]|uniref:hypothetical protein n=1 Tax=unclassified Streptomyces TaxID=2593676 RepID=UPI00369FCE72